MVDTFSDIPLGEPCENCPFGQDHAQHCVDVFNTGLLVAAHGVAVIAAGSAVPFPVILQIIRSAEFRPPVGQHAFEKNVELHGIAKCFLEPVENGLHGAGCAPV